jgi:membrane-bound ClpP family serine protease
MARTIQELFTPIFIVIALSIFITGIIGIQILDRLFAGSKNLNAIRMFALAILINIIILVFILMSFSKIKFTSGTQGPQGNKGSRGGNGKDGGISLCNKKYQTAEEKKTFERLNDYLDLKPPVLELD